LIAHFSLSFSVLSLETVIKERVIFVYHVRCTEKVAGEQRRRVELDEQLHDCSFPFQKEQSTMSQGFPEIEALRDDQKTVDSHLYATIARGVLFTAAFRGIAA
jgi:hypothetical protein